jgi:nitroreductase
MDQIGLFEAIGTQRQHYRFRRDPVPSEVLDRVVEAATKAPSGGNCQPWEFIVVTDRALIQRIGEMYRDLYVENNGPGPKPGEPPEPEGYRAGRTLARHMHEVPALIFVCVDHTRGYMPYRVGEPIVRDRYASSIWLAVQNLFLAARALGLGTRLTTLHLYREAEFKALLSIPEHVETMALVPVGYPRGRFAPPNRRPFGEVTCYNQYGNRASRGGGPNPRSA